MIIHNWLAIICVAISLVCYGWLLYSARPRPLLVTKPWEANDMTVPPRCKHTSVPWPVISGGDLVAWLCDECGEQRERFTCPPPPRPKVICDHHERIELRSMDNWFIDRYCQRCGHRDRVVSEFEFVPMTPLLEGEKSAYNAVPIIKNRNQETGA